MVEKPVVIEQTAKKWKAIQAAGLVVVVIAAGIYVLGMRLESQGVMLTGVGVLTIGIGVHWTGRAIAWWHHG